MSREVKFWSTGSTNGESTQLCHKWNEFCLASSGVADCEWRNSVIKKRDGVFSYSRLVFLTKQYMPSPPNNKNVVFWSSKQSWKHCCTLGFENIGIGFHHYLSMYEHN